MRKILALAMLALMGCAASKGNNNSNPVKVKQCNIILNAPDFFREALKDLNPFTAEFHENDAITSQTCKPFETITCEGIEYRLYDLCLPSRRITCTIITEEDFL